jgi:hypothetical protein
LQGIYDLPLYIALEITDIALTEFLPERFQEFPEPGASVNGFFPFPEQVEVWPVNDQDLFHMPWLAQANIREFSLYLSQLSNRGALSTG